MGRTLPTMRAPAAQSPERGRKRLGLAFACPCACPAHPRLLPACAGQWGAIHEHDSPPKPKDDYEDKPKDDYGDKPLKPAAGEAKFTPAPAKGR